MNIHYKIVEVYHEESQIVIRYWTDVISELELASDENRYDDGTPVRCRTDVSVDVPNPEPEGEELEKFLMQFCPIAFLEKLENIRNPEIDTSINTMQSLLNVKKTIDKDELKKNINPVVPDPEIQKESAPELSEQEFQELIDKLTVS
jgi:hypothetical protein